MKMYVYYLVQRKLVPHKNIYIGQRHDKGNRAVNICLAVLCQITNGKNRNVQQSVRKLNIFFCVRTKYEPLMWEIKEMRET